MNHLANQTSPYLLQHADQPVDWYPWGEEAFTKAKTENKPIFLSIGYAACHWCHVMAHESFDSPWIAEQINHYFVPIKVDREERPDVDQIYMAALIALTGQGGWPLSIFLTPDLQPFYGGTYFPPEPRYGMPSINDVLQGIHTAWEQQRENVLNNAANLTRHLQQNFSNTKSENHSGLNTDEIFALLPKILANYDWQYGGWGSAPKFPAPMLINFLLQSSQFVGDKSLQPALHTLLMMSQGGIFDLVDGGFHRYSTDRTWTIPHFEKMLYDNAQLLLAYLNAYQNTRNTYFRDIATSTLKYLTQTLMSKEGGVYSSQDADSDGIEGAYYLFSSSALRSNINEHQLPHITIDIPENGHIDRQYVLKLNPPHLPDGPAYMTWQPFSMTELQPFLNSLHTLRQARNAPAIDDKIILSWNALCITALTRATQVLNDPIYLDLARKTTDFLLNNLYVDGDLQHSWRNGSGNGVAFLEDYASLSVALLQLYQATVISKYFQLAQKLVSKMLELFSSNGTFLTDTQMNQANLITPVLELQDMVTPSGMAMAAHALLLMDALQPSLGYKNKIDQWLGAITERLERHPSAHAYWLQQSLLAGQPDTTVILVYPADKATDADDMIKEYFRRYSPFQNFIAWQWDKSSNEQQAEILQDKIPQNNDLTLYFCENHTCQQPIIGLNAIEAFFSNGRLPG